MSQAKNVLGLVYANWCFHCQMMKPMWERMKQETQFLKQYNLDIKEVESAEMEKAKSSPALQKLVQNVQGFPSVKLIVNNKSLEYNGERTVEGWKKFIQENLGKKQSLQAGGKKRSASPKPKAKAKAAAKPKAKAVPKKKTVKGGFLRGHISLSDAFYTDGQKQ